MTGWQQLGAVACLCLTIIICLGLFLSYLKKDDKP